MYIQHNLPAMNSLRQAKVNNSFASKNLEKLSSGYKINRAGDDAAGLAISEKMRGQIRGLEQAQKNIQDGSSLIKTADGAMQTGHDLLHRVRELLVQASNGTYSEFDRKIMQGEIDQLMREMDDLSYRTEFNLIKVLRGKPTGMPDWVNILTDANSKMMSGIYSANGYNYQAAAKIDFSALNPSNIDELVNNGFNHTCCTCTTRFSIRFNDQGNDAITNDAGNFILEVGVSGIQTGEQLVQRIMDASLSTGFMPPLNASDFNTNGLMNHFTRFAVDPSNPSSLVVYDIRPNQSAPSSGNSGELIPGVWAVVTDPTVYLPIQAGANKGEVINIPITTVDTFHMGLRDKNNISLIATSPIAAANASISLVDGAINFVSSKRANLGAVQNRLEHAMSNVMNSHENLQSAESSVRDVDLAKEMMSLTKNNILTQASQSMLAQANQIPQNVLQLLQAA